MIQDAPVSGLAYALRRQPAEAGYEAAIPDLWHRHGRMIGFDPVDDAEANRPTASTRKCSAPSTTVRCRWIATQHPMRLGGSTDPWRPWGPVSAPGMCIRPCRNCRTGSRPVRCGTQRSSPTTLPSPHHSVDAIGELSIGIGTADKASDRDAPALPRRHRGAGQHHAANLRRRGPRRLLALPTYHEEAATVGWNATTEMFDRVLG